jgi:hypothetical protein
MSAMLSARRSLSVRFAGVAVRRPMLSMQSRSVATWLVSKNHTKNQHMQATAMLTARANGVKYVSPFEIARMSKNERENVLRGENLYVIAEQEDVNSMHLLEEGGVIVEHGASRVIKEITGEQESIVQGGEIVRTHPLTQQGRAADQQHGSASVKAQLTLAARESNSAGKNKNLIFDCIPGIVLVQCYSNLAAKAISEKFNGPVTGVDASIKMGDSGITLVHAYMDEKTKKLTYAPIPAESVAEKIQVFVNGKQSDKPTPHGDLALILVEDDSINE